MIKIKLNIDSFIKPLILIQNLSAMFLESPMNLNIIHFLICIFLTLIKIITRVLLNTNKYFEEYWKLFCSKCKETNRQFHDCYISNN